MVTSILFFFILFWVALSSGSQLLRLFRCRMKEPLEELVLSYALGLFLLSYLVLGLGIAGTLERKWLVFGLGFFALAGIFRASRLRRLMVEAAPSQTKDPWEGRLWILFCLMMGLIGLGALVPPFGTDALVYHLSGPAHFLRTKQIDVIPYDGNSHFPFFTEMLFTLGLAFQSEGIAQLFHWSLGALAAFSLVAFFQRFFKSKKWGIVAGIFFLLTPGVFNEMKTALADVSWTTYGFLSFYTLMVGLQERRKGWISLSAFFLGITLSIKYLAILSGVVYFCIYMIFTTRGRWKLAGQWRWGLAIFFMAAAVSVYWYLKSYLVFGNPFYPYFNPLFGLEPLGAGFYAPGEYAHKAGMGRSIWSLFLLPFHLTFFPTRFDGWAEQLGPAYLVFLPFAFQGSWTKARLAALFYVGVYLLGWFWLAQVTRFFYPALPFLVLLITSGIFLFYRNQRRKSFFFRALLVLVFLCNTAMLVYHSRETWAYLSGSENIDDFLSRRERSYSMAKFINENLTLDAKILNAQEFRMYYFRRNLVREGYYRFQTKYDQVPDLKSAVQRLKADGFTHVLITEDGSEGVREGIHTWAAVDTRGKELGLVHRTEFSEKDGQKIEYSLYLLK